MATLSFCLSFAFIIHISVGSVELNAKQVIDALLGQPSDITHSAIVNELRLPRALVAVLSGAMLGIAGAILQLLTRNPLAEPTLLGIAGGAIFLMVLGFTTSAISIGSHLLPLLGVVGGISTSLMVYFFSYNQGSDPARLLLIGILVAGVFTAATTFVLLASDDTVVRDVVRWTIGSTNGRVWVHLNMILPYAVIGLPIACLSAGLANVLQLGDEMARSLGQRVELTKLWLLAVAAFLTAAAVSVVGAIALIGLIGPHIARRFTGGDARRLLPLSGIVTALLLLISDILARTFELSVLVSYLGFSGVGEGSLPVGAVTAIIGVPFFLFLLLKRPISP